MRILCGYAIMLLAVSIGLWPAWLGPEWIVIGGSTPNFPAAVIVVVVTGMVMASDAGVLRLPGAVALRRVAEGLGRGLDHLATLGFVGLVLLAATHMDLWSFLLLVLLGLLAAFGVAMLSRWRWRRSHRRDARA